MVKGILLKIASVGKTRRIKDANLGKRLCMLTTFTITNTGTYHGVVLAPNSIKARRVGPTLITRIILLVCMFEAVEVVVTYVIACKDIGKTEGFPTPASTKRRMVYGGVAVSFDVLTIPFLRDCTSL